ncbi:MAG: sigma-54-dependent Fis family transcriptional regulator [Spirochaetaceae bacterium]|nr:MAG: sigma-54-dependent Fis family transcriptional regulator [Spirochaetaceae bacterium]
MPKRKHPGNPILVVDDEASVLTALSIALGASGYTNTISCQDARKVEGILEEQDVGVLLLDLNMPHIPGKILLPKIREEHPDLPIIIISGITEVALAVECMKQGVFDYLVKPIEISKLQATVGRALEIRELRRENISLRRHLIERQLNNPDAFVQIIYRNEQMRAVLLYVESIADSRQTVLITGETGTGKELIAQAIHLISGRKGELVTVNVAGYDENMFADALFGHLKGAYTGADRARSGLVEKAERGTLFLDEIGDLKMESQVKLLRLMESGEYYPLGSDVPSRTDTRILVATNRDLETEVGNGVFRKDLYFRLKTHHVHLPPLRERIKDLPVLADHFFNLAAEELGKPLPKIPPELYGLLSSYHFPGNIRELRSLIFDAMSRHLGGTLSLNLFKEAIRGKGKRIPRIAKEDFFAGAVELPTIKEATEMLVTEAMKRAESNQSIAARILGITPQALSQRLKRVDGRKKE